MDLSADFHVFGLEWNPDSIIWTIDGVEVKRHTGDGVPQVPLSIQMNLAVGGGDVGSPDATTHFPAVYQIDYVRAYSRAVSTSFAGPKRPGERSPAIEVRSSRPLGHPASRAAYLFEDWANGWSVRGRPGQEKGGTLYGSRLGPREQL